MKNFVLLLTLFFCVSLSAQTNDPLKQTEQQLAEHYKNPIPNLHLHLNKTTYAAGEELWYTAYAYDRVLNTISQIPFNINVALLDKDQNEISKQLLYLPNGTASNSIFIKADLDDGIYYLKAFSASMNTLEIDVSFVQPITIINSELPTTVSIEPETIFDIQFQPEGGHIVEGIKNTIGLKILDSNGISANPNRMTLYDSNQQIIFSNLKTNQYGMARFEYTPKAYTSYFLEVEINGKTVTKQLPVSKDKGLTLNTSVNYHSGQLNIELTTNASTLTDLTRKPIYLMIHKDEFTKTFPVSFEQGYPQITFKIPNKDLFPGINVITVFDQDQRPIAERIVFNHKGLKKSDISISEVKHVKDTTSYIIHSKLDNSSIRSYISISVLPEHTIANMKESRLLSNVYLAPFIKGYIEDPGYYFSNDFSPQKKYQLDLLLLNQGWSKYEWRHIFGKPKIDYYTIDAGISIDGYVDVLDKESIPKHVFLYSKDNEDIQMAEIYDENKFKFRNLKFCNVLWEKENSAYHFASPNSIRKPLLQYQSLQVTK